MGKYPQFGQHAGAWLLNPSARNRICIINRNVPNMVAKIASKLGECGINIENMANKARGNHAYTIVETNDTIDQAAIEEIRRSEGIIRVRVIHFALKQNRRQKASGALCLFW